MADSFFGQASVFTHKENELKLYVSYLQFKIIFAPPDCHSHSVGIVWRRLFANSNRAEWPKSPTPTASAAIF